MNQRLSFRQSISIQELLHLAALNAFALVQPLLDRLAANAGYLRLENYSGAAVLISITLLLIAIPLSVATVVTTLRWRGKVRSASIVLGCGVALLSTMSLLIVARWCSLKFDLLTAGIPDSGMALIAVCGGVLASPLYFRSRHFRQMLSLSATAVILFPLFFLSTPAIQELVLGIAARQYQIQVVAGNPKPVVMIVFDGLCGMSLLNDKHEIDRERYPAFARLADISTTYRNATTVHTRTDHALPAILCSVLPTEAQQPIEADYPTNLFRMIHNTQQYDMTIFEPVTQMAPIELKRVIHQRSVLQQTQRLTDTLLRVYLKISVPQELESLGVDIPREWFGILPRSQDQNPVVQGLIRYGWDTGRGMQCQHFFDCLEPASRPGFRFLHVVVPHDPWNLLPSGRSYARGSSISDPILGCDSDSWSTDEWLVNQAWQRYLFQLQFADLWLGRFLDRLEQTGQLDESLIVVTADHGMSFVPGTNRRTPVDDSLADIVSVPLIIKQPGQSNSVVSDRNVETTDILPTIADILQLPTDGVWEGSSLLDDSSSRFRKTIKGHVDTVIDADFVQRFRYVDRMTAVFGTGGPDDRLWKLHTIPALVNSPIASLTTGEPSDLRCQLLSDGPQLRPELPDFVPCFFRGRLVEKSSSRTSNEVDTHALAVSLNGIILATTRTSTDAAFEDQWGVILPDSAFRPEGNQLQVFEVEIQGDAFVLHEIELERIQT